ncbi:unnamed protein product [Macrosiphum euphorbiae]|nr:unnamed protein product [Macrosiphum euphorbiae]
MVKPQTKYVIKTFRSDCGLEYKNFEVQSILNHPGIKHETSVPYTPEQNGKAERSMRTICEAARTMIYAKNFPKSLWAEAVNTVEHGQIAVAVSPLPFRRRNFAVKPFRRRCFDVRPLRR